MKDVWVTSCFHRFCENCIKGNNLKIERIKLNFILLESVNTSHRCPLCNKQLQQDDIQRDAQYNTLLGLIISSLFKNNS